MRREITPSGVSVGNRQVQWSFIRTVIYAVGQKPLREEAMALSGCAGEFHQIGDCAVPKNILAATQAAWTVAREIGS